jgi:hypothetical protein
MASITIKRPSASSTAGPQGDVGDPRRPVRPGCSDGSGPSSASPTQFPVINFYQINNFADQMINQFQIGLGEQFRREFHAQRERGWEAA